MSAEVIAGELGLDLYTVNLATVVDKYVGETEKNLERIFAEAGGVNAVLLFDEADAIFGKRSEVRDAHDRYANIESAYLLQRMETFDGLAMLATNLRANIDEAFTRRLDAIVDFPAPDADLRRTLWDQLPRAAAAPRRRPRPRLLRPGVRALRRQHPLGRGHRRVPGRRTGPARSAWRELIAAVQREYRKLGRLVLEREFGPYYQLVRLTCPGRKRCPEVRAAGPCQGPASGGTVRSMRAHDHDHDGSASPRPRAARLDGPGRPGAEPGGRGRPLGRSRRRRRPRPAALGRQRRA